VIDNNVFQLSQPGTFLDPLTEVLRNGARALLAQAVEAEVAALLGGHADERTDREFEFSTSRPGRNVLACG